MPSIFPFEATTASKISKGRTTRMSRVNWSMKRHPLVAALNTIQVVFLKAVRVQKDYEVHVCHCKQFEDQVKQLEKEVAESKGEAAEVNRQLEEAKEENSKLKTFKVSQARDELIELKKHLKEAKAEIAKLTERLDEMNSQSKEYQKLAKQQKFCFSNIEESDKDVHFYTGLRSANVFYQLLDYVSPGRKRSNVVYRATAQQWTSNEHRDGLEPGQAAWREYDTVVGHPASLSQVMNCF